MYYYTWDGAPEPGGSFATHPAHDVFKRVLDGITAIDLVLQSYTVFLMLRVSVSQLKEYRFFMLLCTTFDIGFAVSFDVLFQPRLLQAISQCISVKGLAGFFGHQGGRVAYGMIFFCGTGLIAAQVYCLMYRVVSIMDNHKFKECFIQRKTCFFLITLGCTIDLIFGYGFFLTSLDPNVKNDTVVQTHDFVLNKLNATEYITADDTSIICAQIWKPTSAIMNAITMISFCSTQTCSAFAGVWIIRKLRRDMSQSVRGRQMQLQLTRLLLLQMFCPVICMVGPVAYLIVPRYAYVPLVPSYLCIVAINIFPCVNALLTITFVGPYRRFTAQFFYNFFCGKFNETATSQAESGSGTRQTMRPGPVPNQLPLPNNVVEPR